eukprot:UN10500
MNLILISLPTNNDVFTEINQLKTENVIWILLAKSGHICIYITNSRSRWQGFDYLTLLGSVLHGVHI